MIALPDEARALLGRQARAAGHVARTDGAAVLVGGIGPERATRAAERLLAEGARALASFGIAGGLDPALAAGALIVPEQVLAADHTVLDADAEWHARLVRALQDQAPDRRSMVLVPRALADAAAKLAAFHATGAAAVDMESAAVAAVAARAGVPFACVRAVSDPAHLRIPPSAMTGVALDGTPRRGAFLLALARRPLELPAVLELRSAYFAAIATLELVARRTGAALAFHGERPR